MENSMAKQLRGVRIAKGATNIKSAHGAKRIYHRPKRNKVKVLTKIKRTLGWPLIVECQVCYQRIELEYATQVINPEGVRGPKMWMCLHHL